MTDDKPKAFFDEEKQKKAIDWINQKCGDLECECCKAKQWQLTPEIVAPPIFRGGTILGGAVSPAFTLVCMNCGNTKLFNALVSKVLPLPEEKPEEKKEGEHGN